MTPDAPAPRRRITPLVVPLAASLVAVLLAGAAPPASSPTPARGISPWTVESGNRGSGGSRGERVEDRTGWNGPEDEAVIRPFLLARTDARAVLSGPVAHTVLRQEWTNPNLISVEGTYIFPLPDNAAVTALRMTVGSRRIEAEMRRREEARAVYEQAKSQGRVAALLDQERANIFAQRVANISPGEPIEVTIEFDHELRCDDGACEYILPTVVGPRFVPARQGDPGRIDPPVTPPGIETGHRLTFALDMDEGMPIHDLESPSHRMAIRETGFGRAQVRLDSEEGARLDRDVIVRFRLGGREAEFGVLAWRAGRSASGGDDPAGSATGSAPGSAEGRTWWGAPESGPGSERPGEAPGIFTLFLMPPVESEAEAQATPRELTFILDCSGSMKGEPIEASKEVVRRALRAARASDTLQVLRFSDRASGLWPDPVPVTPANVKRALEYLDTLQGDGGTEMLSGIRAALDRPPDRERLRLVALLTDGFIGNENEVLAEVRRILGPARLFSFGIGSSVNRFLLENLAQEGRGTASFLGVREDPEDMVKRFVHRIGTPVLTDLRLSWEGIDVGDLEPELPPDLFAGQPLVIHGRYRQPGAGTLVLEGVQRGGRRLTLRRTVTLPSYAEDHEALARLWARARIARLTRESYGRLDPDSVDAIARLGIRFHLMTEFTSLVAVDRVVTSRGGVTRSVDVPVELPSGMDPAGIFGKTEEAKRKAASGGVPRMAVLGNAAPRSAASPAAGYSPGPGGLPRDEAARQSARLAAEPPQAGLVAPNTAELTRQPSRSPADQAPDAGSISFVLVRLVEEDGTTRTVEADGEAWLVAEKRRSLVRRLGPDAMRALKQALVDSDAEHWLHGDATFARGRARLVVVLTDGTTHSVEVPSGDPTVEAIVTLLRAATFDAPGLPQDRNRR
jgi:Ca-activated chloride channel family protein